MIMKFEMPKFDMYSFDMNENIALLAEDGENIGGKFTGSNIF